MRCPDCQYISSDSHDICPKCRCDLRPAKTAAGLTATNAKASYEDLLRSLGATPPASIAAQQTGVSPKTKQFPESASAQSKGTTTSTASPTQKTATPAAPHKRVSAPAREVPLPPKKEPMTSQPQDAPAAKSTAAPRTAAPLPPRLRAAEELRSSIFKIHRPAAAEQEMGAAFDDAYVECTAIAEQTAVELTQEHLRNVGRDEAIEALFNLAFEVIAHPEREAQLTEKFTTSDQRQVEASSLVTELAKVEKRLSLPVMGLRSIRERVASARQAERTEPIKELRPASVTQRAQAICIDLLCCILIASVFIVVSALIIDPPFFAQLKALRSSSEATKISALVLSMSIVPFVIVLYPLLSSIAVNQTLGQRISGIRLSTELGRRVKISHLLVRCLLLPLSYAAFGYLPLVFGKQSLHDALARTRVTLQ